MKMVTMLLALVTTTTAFGGCGELPLLSDDQVMGELVNDDCRINDLIEGEDDSRVDVYSLELTKPGSISISVNSNQFDPYLYVFNEDYSILYAEQDDSAGSFNVGITGLMLSSGTYKVLVNSSTHVSDLGSYDLSISDEGQVNSDMFTVVQTEDSRPDQLQSSPLVDEKHIQTAVVNTSQITLNTPPAIDKTQKSIEPIKTVDKVVETGQTGEFDTATLALMKRLKQYTSLSDEQIMRFIQIMENRRTKK